MQRGTILSISALAVIGVIACADPDPDDVADDVPAAQEMTGTYARWDANQDSYLDEPEFAVWWTDRRDGLDWDLDDGVTRDEYSENVFAVWDENDDDILDESEWRRGADRVWGVGRYQTTFPDWDGDGDSELDLNEVREGLERDGLYDRVDGDRDGLIDDEELADWFFDIFDANDDTRIDTTEWESTWLEKDGR